MSAFKTITVTVEMPFVVPMVDATHSAINGWSIEEVAQEWFALYDINSYHASRDAHRLGNGLKVLNVRIDP
jgi:hypothetical protein